MAKRLEQIEEALRLAHAELSVSKERCERAERSRIERTEELETKLRERTNEIEKLQKQSDKSHKKESNAKDAAEKRATDADALCATLRREKNEMEERLAAALSKVEALESKESTAAETDGTPVNSISQFVPADLEPLDVSQLYAFILHSIQMSNQSYYLIYHESFYVNFVPVTTYFFCFQK